MLKLHGAFLSSLCSCIKDNIVLIRRAFTADFVLPEFSKFCSVIDDVYWMCRTNTNGKVRAKVMAELTGHLLQLMNFGFCLDRVV